MSEESGLLDIHVGQNRFIKTEMNMCLDSFFSLFKITLVFDFAERKSSDIGSL